MISPLFTIGQISLAHGYLSGYIIGGIEILHFASILNTDIFRQEQLHIKRGFKRNAIIVFNALASVLWQDRILQEMFLCKIRMVTGIDADIWRRETARIRYSTGSRSVGRQAIALRASLCTALKVPRGQWI